MNYEEKLKYIPDWVELWAGWKIRSYQYHNLFWKCFYDYGFLLTSSLLNETPPTFDNYLKMIEQDKNK